MRTHCAVTPELAGVYTSRQEAVQNAMVAMENICAMKVFDEAGEFIRGWDDLADYKEYPHEEFEFGGGYIQFKLVKS